MRVSRYRNCTSQLRRWHDFWPDRGVFRRADGTAACCPRSERRGRRRDAPAAGHVSPASDHASRSWAVETLRQLGARGSERGTPCSLRANRPAGAGWSTAPADPGLSKCPCPTGERPRRGEDRSQRLRRPERSPQSRCPGWHHGMMPCTSSRSRAAGVWSRYPGPLGPYRQMRRCLGVGPSRLG